jgi:hypothetical protein
MPPRLPKLRHPPEQPTGPAFIPKPGGSVSGPGDPPPGFVTGKNSATEWNAYWALWKIFDTPRDARVPPFVGGPPDWMYQSQQQTLFGISSSTNVDFVVYEGGTILAIRIQTERYHNYADSKKQAYDQMQEAALDSRGLYVVNVYDNDLLNDPSGQRYVVAMKQAIGRIQRVNPDIAGTALRGSRQRVIR